MLIGHLQLTKVALVLVVPALLNSVYLIMLLFRTLEKERRKSFSVFKGFRQ